MRFSKRITKLAPSATLAMAARASELRAAGRDIISLTIGEPDFATPDHVCEAAKDAIDERFTKYTLVGGMPELRQAVADYYGNLYGVATGEKNTVVTNGGKHALYNLFITLLDPGDEVIVPAPYWVSYPEMVTLTGGVPVIVAASAEQGFKVTPEQLEKSRTSKTKMLILNTPSNPTGACYTCAEVDALARWALDNKILVVSDEIYDQLVYPPVQFASLAPWWEKHPENFVVCGGLSKSFAMPGWRVGFVLGAPELIKALIRLQGQTTSHISSISQKAALAALRGGLETVYAMRESFQRRRDLAHAAVSSWPGVFCPKPAGTFYIFRTFTGASRRQWRIPRPCASKFSSVRGWP